MQFKINYLKYIGKYKFEWTICNDKSKNGSEQSYIERALIKLNLKLY